NALIYETALSVANGAKCSIGDQLHPLGCFEPATYRLIGAAYAEIEKREQWCHDVTAVTDIAIFTTYQDRGHDLPDVGANRILLEGKYLYNIIDAECNFADYKLVIFPDIVSFDEALTAKVNAYLAAGGKILLSGESGLFETSGAAANRTFFTDFGVIYQGRSEIDASYLVPTYEMNPNGVAPYLMYERGHLIEVTDDVQILAHMQDSYFNRSFRRFCSHRNTPNDPNSLLPGAVISGGIGYIAWNVFSEYGEHGAYHHKQIVCDMLDALLGKSKTLTTTLPSNGIITLMEQKEENRYVNHLLYAVTKLRGNTEVIEDAPITINTKVSIQLPAAPSRVYLAPEEKDIEFTYENGILRYTVDQFTLHGMVVIDK
ncbi:MAG: beta-galactosidase trimerization domain-containing protein, partial [Clostridia bacterium]|nr:beta-galactosidase trimerization domain-containing protein [Clostridia bacterium]